MAIEGLISGGSAVSEVHGALQLPPEFDRSKCTGSWVKKGAKVARAQQMEHIDAQNQAMGWAVWRDAKGRTCTRTLASGAYVLMFRPRQLQEAIQKIYGNVSRERLLGEATGKTVAGQPLDDSGVLPSPVLAQIPGHREEVEVPDIQLNAVDEEETRRASTVRATSRIKPKTK